MTRRRDSNDSTRNTSGYQFRLFDQQGGQSQDDFAIVNLTIHVVSLQPGIINTELDGEDMPLFVAPDTTELPGQFCIWLLTNEARFLKKKFVWANCDIQELVARKDEVVTARALTWGVEGVPEHDMDLVFINNNSVIDNNTRAVIRRQAAKGQNLGRKITRPSRVKAFERQALVKSLSAVDPKVESAKVHKESCKQDCGLRRDIEDAPSRVEPVVGDSVSVLSLPIEIAQEDRALMYEAVAFMNSPRCLPSLAKALADSSVSHSIFLQLIFTDQAYYHCALATVLECTHASPRASISATRHLIEAFRLINERISQAERVSNSTIAVVMSLSTYESTRGRYDHGMIHLSGLFRMVEMRGGLDRFGSEEPELIQKIYRSDLDYALRLGASPKLNIKLFENANAMERLDMPSLRQHNYLSMVSNSEFREQLGPELCELWESASGLSMLVNEASEGKRAKLPKAQFLRSYVWLGHQLLNYAPLNKLRSLNRVQNMAHLGLLILISSLLCGLDRRVVENSVLSQLLRKEARLGANSKTQELLLWLLFLGAAGILQDPSHDTWLIPKTWETMQTLGLNTWDSTKRVLLRFPWMNDFYERGSSALFYRVAPYQGTQLSISKPL